ncbi:hypothetical protein GF324_09360 [bacterium]|nr:hypothetical protein [bacterium]
MNSFSVHQPHYLPYPGYLDKVQRSDVFVFLERVQYVRREYQNRNRIKTPQGPQWLTVPVKGAYGAAIDDVAIDDSTDWRGKHLATLRRAYAKAPFVEELEGFAEVIGRSYETLAELTIATTGYFLDRFGIVTPRHRQTEFADLPNEPSERIAEMGKRLHANRYLAGSGGRSYMNMEPFERVGMEVEFLAHQPRPYPQQHGEFIPHLGSIDLMLNLGPEGFHQLYSDRR